MKKKQFDKLINNLGKDFSTEERETSILYDLFERVVHLETTHTFTARRWYKLFDGDPNVIFDERSDTFKITVPIDYCRPPELVVKAKHRTTKNK